MKVSKETFFKLLYHFVLFLTFIGNLVGLTLFFILKKLSILGRYFLRMSDSLIKKVHPPKIIFKKLSFHVRDFLIGALVTLLIFTSIKMYVLIRDLPSPENIGRINYPVSTEIFDRNGQILYEIFNNQRRNPVRLVSLPKQIIEATLAIEDKNFYKHDGISISDGILRAIKDMVKTRRLQGGSTITQQLVKMALLTPERTIQRKIKEIILALWAERLYTKNQILEMYLNQVPYGGASYGIEEAAQNYFGKKAKDLGLTESAFLAGLPQAPTFYSPYTNPELALRRRNEVLKAMYEQNYISWSNYQKAINKKLVVLPPRNLIRSPHFVFNVKRRLEKKYGVRKVEEGGLKVTTTLDLTIQNEAEKILREELAKIKSLNVTNGAVLVTKPATGEILAMVGSVDFFATPSGAFNVTTALRQPGSSIKPLMYSLALKKGYTAATVINDAPIVFQIKGSKPYRPVNYDNRFHGNVPLRYALANSYNIPAVKVFSHIGVSAFVNYARKLGITTWTQPSRYGLSLTLGGAEVKMVDMATAYGVFANLGNRVNLTDILKITDYRGRLVDSLRLTRKKVIDPGIAFIISDILSDSMARRWAFGSHSDLEIPGYKIAVKTGTTNDKRDNWTIGYNPDFLVAVWVGNNNNSPMNKYLTSGITGASPIWHRLMTFLLKNYSSKKNWFKKPNDVVSKRCYFGRQEYFIKGTEKKVSCRQNLFKTTPSPTP